MSSNLHVIVKFYNDTTVRSVCSSHCKLCMCQGPSDPVSAYLQRNEKMQYMTMTMVTIYVNRRTHAAVYVDLSQPRNSRQALAFCFVQRHFSRLPRVLLDPRIICFVSCSSLIRTWTRRLPSVERSRETRVCNCTYIEWGASIGRSLGLITLLKSLKELSIKQIKMKYIILLQHIT